MGWACRRQPCNVNGSGASRMPTFDASTRAPCYSPRSQTAAVRNVVACGLWLCGERELARGQINALAYVYAKVPWCHFGPGGWARTLGEAAREVGAVLH